MFSNQEMAPVRTPSLSQTTFSLPPELQLMVVENLLGDAKSLISCSLVAKSWIFISRTFLFRRMSLHLPATGSQANKICDFIRLLHDSQAASRPIGRHIVDLALIGDVQRNDLDDDEPAANTPFITNVLPLMLPFVPQLRFLRMKGLLFLSVGYIPIPKSPSRTDKERPGIPLRLLTLEHCGADDQDVRHVVDVLNMFESVDSLSFMECGPWERLPDNEMVAAHTPPPRITARKLAIKEYTPIAAVYDFVTLGKMACKLEFDSFLWESVPPFFRLLRTTAFKLVELHLRIVEVLADNPGACSEFSRFVVGALIGLATCS